MSDHDDRARELGALFEAAEFVLSEIKDDHHIGKTIEGAINWGDLHCCDAVHCRSVHDDDEWYEVLIEEVSPDAYKLGIEISARLAQQGFKDVRVRCEW
jgi:hypothetical protein